MARSLRRRERRIDYWPGFVDALSTMLLVIIFLLSVFMLAQFFQSREVSGKDTALTKLNHQIDELTALLALERANSSNAQSTVAMLTATLDESKKEQSRLKSLLETDSQSIGTNSGTIEANQKALDNEKQVSAKALMQVELLNQQITALRMQLSAIQEALNASEAKDQQSQAQIADLGSRLNVALAQKVQELTRYRSDFFGRLRDILGSRPGIRVVGDRFVFESEVLFDSGQATLSAGGKAELDKVAGALTDLEREIPPEIPWVVRVDGHTDKRPIIPSSIYGSNWGLSAARAISVVQYLISKGVLPTHLVAAGFGEYQPIDNGSDEEALRRNRRIELKLTEK